jgi:hypothetical protein
MQGLLLMLALAALLWFWYDSMKARERTLGISRLSCQRMQAQLLDETVALTRLRLCRTPGGTVALCRRYRFDFTLDGMTRRSGRVDLQGQRITEVLLDIDSPDGWQ